MDKPPFFAFYDETGRIRAVGPIELAHRPSVGTVPVPEGLEVRPGTHDVDLAGAEPVIRVKSTLRLIPDALVVDGVPAIAADGVASTTIEIRAEDADGVLVPASARIRIDADGGSLSALAVDLDQGVGAFRLRSETRTVKVRVRAYDPTGLILPGETVIQFLPVPEGGAA